MQNPILTAKSYAWLPHFLKRIKHTARDTSLPEALHQAFTHAHVQVVVEGTLPLDDATRPLLLINGLHRPFESFFLLSVLGAMHRKDIRIVGAPYSCIVRLIKTLAEQDEGYILPVIPGYLAKDKKISLNGVRLCLFHRRLLPDSTTIRERNLKSLQESAAFLRKGGVISIFPTGHYSTVLSDPWFTGVGHILASLPADARKAILIVNYRLDTYQPFSVAWSLVLSHYGMKADHKTITLTVKSSGSVAEIIGELRDAKHITEMLRMNYIRFASQRLG